MGEELALQFSVDGQLLHAGGLDVSPGRYFRAVLARSEEQLPSSQPPLPAEPHTEKVRTRLLPGGPDTGPCVAGWEGHGVLKAPRLVCLDQHSRTRGDRDETKPP